MIAARAVAKPSFGLEYKISTVYHLRDSFVAAFGSANLAVI